MSWLWLRNCLRLLPSSWALAIIPLVARRDAWRCSQLLRWHAGFDIAKPIAPRACGRRLRARYGSHAPDTATQLLTLLSGITHLHDSSHAALELIEGYMGITGIEAYPTLDLAPDEYRVRRQQLAIQLRTALARVPRETIGSFLAGWLGICSHVPERGGLLGLALVECALDLEAGAYTTANLQSQLGPFVEPRATVGSAVLLLSLTVFLQGAGRSSEARQVCQWLLKLAPGRHYTADELLAKVAARLEGIPDELQRALSSLLPTLLHESLGRDENLVFVERLHGIEPDDYLDGTRLRQRLGDELTLVGSSPIGRAGRSATTRRIADATQAALVSLLQALLYGRQYERACRVLSAAAGLPVDTSPDWPEFSDQIERLVARLPDYAQATLRRLIVHTMWASAPLDVALAYAERLLALPSESHGESPASFVDRLRAACGFSPEDLTLFVAGYVALLIDRPERHADARRVLDAYLWEIADSEETAETNPAGVQAICEMFALWLEGVPSSLALQRAGDIVRRLRRFLELRGFAAEDREKFARDVGKLRRLLVQIGYGEADSADQLVNEVLGWDVELSQRLLLERCRAQWRLPFSDGRRRASSSESDSASSSETSSIERLRDGWSLHLPPPAAGRGILPSRHEARGVPLGVLRTKSARVRPDSLAVRVPSEGVGSTSQFDSIGDSKIEPTAELLHRGVTASDLAVALGPNTLMLRAGFLPHGQLFWNAFRSTGEAIEVVARGTSARQPAERWIGRAVTWHERTLDLLWTDRDGRRETLADLAATLTEDVATLADRFAAGDAADAADATTSDEHAELRRRYDHVARRLLESQLQSATEFWTDAALWFSPDTSTHRAGAARHWRELAHWLQRLADPDEPLERLLDLTTALFLNLASEMWDVRDLLPHLNLDTDVVVEVDGALHGVPPAFLPLGEMGGWLFEHVRSVRGGLSLLVPLLATRPKFPTSETGLASSVDSATPGEAEGRRPTSPETLVTISSFNADDGDQDGASDAEAIAQGEWWLHAGQSQLAAREKLRWRSAARTPVGRVASIEAALTGDARVRLLTICGHGDVQAAGVALGDELWNGAGADLSPVDWLLLVSCSIGRLQMADGGDGGPDVEGFVAQLQAQGARAVLVCRWPVHCLQAPWFANVVADAYLGARGNATGAQRAGALASARRRFLGATATDYGILGLNTLAAFELFGEG